MCGRRAGRGCIPGRISELPRRRSLGLGSGSVARACCCWWTALPDSRSWPCLAARQQRERAEKNARAKRSSTRLTTQRNSRLTGRQVWRRRFSSRRPSRECHLNKHGLSVIPEGDRLSRPCLRRVPAHQQTTKNTRLPAEARATGYPGPPELPSFCVRLRPRLSPSGKGRARLGRTPPTALAPASWLTGQPRYPRRSSPAHHTTHFG